NGSGTGASQGRVVNGMLVPVAYQATTTTSKKSETIHINLASGNVKDYGSGPGPPGRCRAHSDHGSAQEGRVRPDDVVAAACARHRRSALAGRLPHGSRRVRRPHALRPETRFQAHG